MVQGAVDEWLNRHNKLFEAKPIDLIKKGETDKIWQMIYMVGSGSPS